MTSVLKLGLMGLVTSASFLAYAQKQNPTVAPTPQVENVDHTGDKQLVSDKAVSFFDLMATDGSGTLKPLSEFRGKVLVVANTASKCGFTPQYKELQELQVKYEGKGFTVIGFPSNDFMSQEPGSNAEIKSFCELNYGVTFPLFAKAHVSGENKQPVYHFLTEKGPSGTQGDIGWNFVKFVINRKGAIVSRFDTKIKPNDPKMIAAIDKALSEPVPPESQPSPQPADKSVKAKKN